MKRFSKIILTLFVASMTFASCNDLLDVDSDKLAFTDDYQLKAANDTLYSMFAIFSQLQKVADSYVILGELRGDLMDVTENANVNLKEINNFEFSKTNPYTNNIKDYYAVINNCNYVIQTIDTSVVKKNNKVFMKVYAASKAIRAWTYMQLALNYDTVTYYEKPILTVVDAQRKDYPKYNFEQLIDILITDLTPIQDVDYPALGVGKVYFPVRFILGDLYLWRGSYTQNVADYEAAATEYRDLIYKSKSLIYNTMQSTWEVKNNAFDGNGTFWTTSSDYMTYIGASNKYGVKLKLDSIVLRKEITSSVVAETNWDTQQYYANATLDTVGDLRKYSSISSSSKGMYIYSKPVVKTQPYFIYKYIMDNPISKTNDVSKAVKIFTVPLLYLRYAEAVNRIGKPNMAFAVLKYGLNKGNVQSYVPAREKGAPLLQYMDFTDERFDYTVKRTDGTTVRITNIGIRMRGCGSVNLNPSYKIPDMPLKEDSVTYVEDLIDTELALETAFEGNRFHDLMRFAIRRNSPAYLADKVSAKYGANKELIKEKLLDKKNWYVNK